MCGCEVGESDRKIWKNYFLNKTIGGNGKFISKIKAGRLRDCLWLNMITGWWFQPLWRIFRQFGSFPQVGMKIKNIWNHRSCRSHRVGAVTRRQSIVSLVLWALQSRTWWYLGVFFFGWGGGVRTWFRATHDYPGLFLREMIAHQN